MTIRRFTTGLSSHDYLEYDISDPDKRTMYNLDGTIDKTDGDWCRIERMEDNPNREELPCYAKDLIEGDIAIVQRDSDDYTHTVYIYKRSGAGDLNMISLTSRASHWDSLNRVTESFKVLALLGNSFDDKRVTYVVKRYG